MIPSCIACGLDQMFFCERAPDGEVYICANCGSMRLKADGSLCTESSDDYGKAYSRGLDPSKAELIYRLMQELVGPNDKKANKLLDVGCGSGAFLDLANASGWNVTGVDSDRNAVRRVRDRGINAEKGTLGMDLDAGGHFDVITLWDVIEHVENPDFAAEWLSRSVTAGGKIIVLTPDADSMIDAAARLESKLTLGRSKRLLGLCLNRYHLHRFTKTGIETLFSRHGVESLVLRSIRLYSLKPEGYLSGFAPGIPGITSLNTLNKLVSRAAFLLLKASGLRNKLVYVGIKA